MGEFSIEERPAATYVGLAVDVTMETIPERVSVAFDALDAYLRSHRIERSGPSVMRYGRVMRSKPFTMQIGFQVADMRWIDHPYAADHVPAGRYVVGRYDGPYAGLADFTARTMAWGDEQAVAYAMEPGRDGEPGEGDSWDAWYEWYPAPPEYRDGVPHGPIEVCLLLRG
ncbi:GyrI-like domain-containing protein [Demequina sp. NBRC 110051]|uniref:GyrI-like domain-containing protein n=1 Tax=Demequina sp. NBRC 110051 TaxID=1570340 RepID=UPI0009FCAD49|nr:GyrI-like domain-containing protein [Demequina sp. NBRC 110051]